MKVKAIIKIIDHKLQHGGEGLFRGNEVKTRQFLFSRAYKILRLTGQLKQKDLTDLKKNS